MFPNTNFVHFADSLTGRVAVCVGLKERCEQNQRIIMYFFVTINTLYVLQIVLIYQVCQEHG